MKAFHHSTRKPGRDWHEHHRANLHALSCVREERNEPTTTGVLHFDESGKRISSTPYQPRTWEQIAAHLPNMVEEA